MEAVNNAEKLDSRWYSRYEAVVFEDHEQFNDNKENENKLNPYEFYKNAEIYLGWR